MWRCIIFFLEQIARHAVSVQRQLCYLPLPPTDAVRQFLRVGLRGDSPHVACLSLPVVDAGLGIERSILQSQSRTPLGSIQVLAAGFRSLWSPRQAPVSALCGRNRKRGIVVVVLPALTGRYELFHQSVVFAVVRHLDGHSLCLHIGAVGCYLDIGKESLGSHVDSHPSRLGGRKDALGVARHRWRHRDGIHLEVAQQVEVDREGL